MLDRKFIDVLKILNSKLKKQKWVIVGSTNLALQGIKIRPKDIDIVTTKRSAFQINKLLKIYEIQPVKRKIWKVGKRKFFEYIGEFRIKGIHVEIIAGRREINKKPKKLPKIKFISLGKIRLPCAKLEEELKVYSELKREKDLKKIKKIKEMLKSMAS